jgi:hypothetical protein
MLVNKTRSDRKRRALCPMELLKAAMVQTMRDEHKRRDGSEPEKAANNRPHNP